MNLNSPVPNSATKIPTILNFIATHHFWCYLLGGFPIKQWNVHKKSGFHFRILGLSFWSLTNQNILQPSHCFFEKWESFWYPTLLGGDWSIKKSKTKNVANITSNPKCKQVFLSRASVWSVSTDHFRKWLWWFNSSIKLLLEMLSFVGDIAYLPMDIKFLRIHIWWNKDTQLKPLRLH